MALDVPILAAILLVALWAQGKVVTARFAGVAEEAAVVVSGAWIWRSSTLIACHMSWHGYRYMISELSIRYIHPARTATTPNLPYYSSEAYYSDAVVPDH